MRERERERETWNKNTLTQWIFCLKKSSTLARFPVENAIDGTIGNYDGQYIRRVLLSKLIIIMNTSAAVVMQGPGGEDGEVALTPLRVSHETKCGTHPKSSIYLQVDTRVALMIPHSNHIQIA